MILDVNSLFLFSGRNGLKNMYSFIDNIKKSVDNSKLIIFNVIDNGISQRVLRKYPYYKQNRIHSIQSNNMNVNKFGATNSFKWKINRIHQLDLQFPSHLTFYLPGEADFKVGQLLKFIQERTPITPSEILTVSFDKDYLLCNTLSDVLLKRHIDNKRQWYLFDEDTDIDEFKKLFHLENLKIQRVFDFFYYLLLSGDAIDNIKQLLNKNNSIKLINLVIEKYNKVNIELLCKHITEFNSALTCNDVYENCYLIDLFNKDAFTTNQKNNMEYLVSGFLRNNEIKVFA